MNCWHDSDASSFVRRPYVFGIMLGDDEHLHSTMQEVGPQYVGG